MSYAVGLLSRFGSKPTVVTCRLNVYTLQCLRCTVHMSVRYSGLRLFTDADRAGDIITQRGISYLQLEASFRPMCRPRRCRLNTKRYMQAQKRARLWVMAEIQKIAPFFLQSMCGELNAVIHKQFKHNAIKYHWLPLEHVDLKVYRPILVVIMLTHFRKSSLHEYYPSAVECIPFQHRSTHPLLPHRTV